MKKYIISRTDVNGYGEITHKLLECWSREKAEKFVNDQAVYYINSEEYEKSKVTQSKNYLVLVKLGDQVRFMIEEVEVDDEGAPWNKKE